jgi:protein phosphatase PTC6
VESGAQNDNPVRIRQIGKMWTPRGSLPLSIRSATVNVSSGHPIAQSRRFHDYFVTHLPSSSLHPDSRPGGTHHKLPRDQSTPHDPKASNRPAATAPSGSRELTVVRIPLRSAKHHFGAFSSRGQRPYNEDTYQAGTIELPAFAARQPISLTRSPNPASDVTSNVAGETGDPQVFYFAVFDGHGGSECSDFLRDELHRYIEDAAKQFSLESSLKKKSGALSSTDEPEDIAVREILPDWAGMQERADQLERSITKAWKELVGGYFRRFKPDFFSDSGGGQGRALVPRVLKGTELVESKVTSRNTATVGIESVLEWSFLKADYDFIAAQVSKDDCLRPDDDDAINADEILGSPSQRTHQIGGPTRFLGGSTCSIALVSTPTPTPFWHPAATSTVIAAHLGDTKILLCETATGAAIPLTSVHHPDHPVEAQRMRRYAATFVTDSFGEARVQGLANTRAFGDMPSKRIGVSAEPELVRVEVGAAQYSFLVLVSDGVCGQLTDQEIVDVVKESRTPEEGARDVVGFATEVTTDGDNATALVVRLGGWERRNEGGGGSLRTKEEREYRRSEAQNPRSRTM